MKNVKIYAKAIITPLLVGGIIGLITSNSMNDFKLLTKPLLAPPAILFPIVWTILYTLMGISYGILKSNNQVDDDINKIYYLQLLVNALWPIIFFTFKWRFIAFLWIILLDGLVIKMIRQIFTKNKVASLLQIPYLIWILFATYLNLFFFLLNR